MSDGNEARGEEKKKGGKGCEWQATGVLVSIFIRTFGAFIATSSQREREGRKG